MSKIIELESSANPVEKIIDSSEKAKNETEEIAWRLMKKTYLLGLTTGMKTMCDSTLKKIDQIKNLNPQKQLIVLRQWCSDNFSSANNKINEESKDATNNIKEDNINAKDAE